MNVLSTFSGVGGMDLGLARAGWRHVGLCERDEYRRAVLSERFPGVPIAHDVREVAASGGERLISGIVGAELNGTDGGRGRPGAADGDAGGDGPCGCEWDNIDADGYCACCGAHIDDPGGFYSLQGQYHEPGECRVPRLERRASGDSLTDERGSRRIGGWDGSWDADRRVDLLCGGFPCQDLSVAGRRAGLAGERSGLFFEFARIAESVRPEWLLIENVPGLLSSNGGRDFGELLGTLADIGYGVAWRILDSRFFGVPQRRRRVFIVAHHSGGRAGAERAGAVLAVGSGCGGHPAAGGEAGQIATGVTGAGSDGPGRGRDEEGSLVTWGHLANGEEASDSCLSCGGSGRTKFGPCGRCTGQGPLRSVRRLTPRECERLQGFPETARTVRMVAWRSSDHTPNRAPADAPSHSEPASVWTADEFGSWRRAGSAESSSSTHRLGLASPVLGRALIDFERGAVQTLSLDGLSEPARSAGASISSRHPWPADDFARATALLLRGLALVARAGGAASPAFSVPFGLHASGEWLVHLSGDVIDELASDAALCMSEASRCMRSITSAASPSSPSFDSTWATLSCCVAAAICGSTPGGIPSGSSFACEVTGTSGWTAIDWKGKPAADARRYAACGDAVTVPVAEWIGRRIAGSA